MGKALRVLLADDHAHARRALRAFLGTQEGYLVVGEAADGAEAIKLARRLQPDLVVMDVEMPGIDGIAATRELSRRWPRIAVVGLSMHGERRGEMLTAGAVAYIEKGLPTDTLLATLAAVAHRGIVEEHE